jgi:predicted nuclease of predicted toxin-antitoxin system
MRILLDEMYSGMKEYFEIMGYNVETVPELGLKGSSDRKIVEYAKEHDLLLITEDRKPAELSSLFGVKYLFVDMKTKAQMIRDKILLKYPELEK